MPALVRKGMYLTKCGRTVFDRDLVTYTVSQVTCSGCLHRPNWPDKPTQRSFDTMKV
jgi:hypothetical protein